MSPKELYKEFGSPKLKPVVRFDEKPLPNGVPMHAIPRVWLGKNSNKIPLSEAEILLTDFGLSFQPSTTPRYHHQSYQGTLLPPEVYFLPQEPLSFPMDIWGLGCAIWELVGLFPLFDAFMCNPTADHMIKQHVALVSCRLSGGRDGMPAQSLSMRKV